MSDPKDFKKMNREALARKKAREDQAKKKRNKGE